MKSDTLRQDRRAMAASPCVALVCAASLAFLVLAVVMVLQPTRAFADEPSGLVAGTPDTTPTYKIVYKLNGGEQAADQVLAIESGTTLNVSQLKKPTRIGYKFMGWYKNKKLTKKATAISGVSKKSKRTVYAKWKFKAYKIVYKLNGGKLPATYKKTIKKGKSYKTSKLKQPVRDGYTFKGWYSNSALTKKAKKIKGKAAASKRTVYAKWTTKVYSITYEANGGTMPPQYIQTYKTSKGLSSLPEPTREGYAFMGWYSDEKLTKHVTELKKGTFGKVTLYAKWRERYVVAHKGYHVTEPENSLASYRAAADRGFLHVETDIQFTADNVPVLSHDDEVTTVEVVEREVEELVPVEDDPGEEGSGDESGEGESSEDGSSDAEGDGTQDEPSVHYETVKKIVEEEVLTDTNIAYLSYSKLQSSKLKGKIPSGEEGRNFTSFEEFIAFCRDAGLVPSIELKKAKADQVRSLVQLVDKYGMGDRVIWSSFHKELLYFVYAVRPASSFQVLDDAVSNCSSKMTVAKRLASSGGEASIAISKSMPAAERSNYLKKCKAEAMPLGIWTFQNESYIAPYSSFYSVFSIDGLAGDRVPSII